MGRLLLLIVLIGIAVFVVAIGGRAIGSLASATQSTFSEDNMPKTFSRIAYVALIILMFGVVSGLLGAS